MGLDGVDVVFPQQSRTFRIVRGPPSLSPHSNTGSPVTLASSTSSVKSAKGRLWAPLRGEGNQASGRQDRGVFLAFGQADRGGAGRINRKPPKLPTVRDTGVAPLGMPTALAVSALVLD